MASIYERLTEFNSTRLPDMLKLKYKAMSVGAFSFFRGTCHLFYQDLSAAAPLPESPLAWICGDLHLENFGSYKGDDRQEYFDLNDFDEAMLAPAAWEIVRMATSIFIAFGSLGLSESEAAKTAAMYLDTYASALKNGKAIHIEPRTAKGVVKTFLNTAAERKQKELLKKRTYKKHGKLALLLDSDRHFEVDKHLRKALSQFAEEVMKDSGYRSYGYEAQDCIFRLAGTGSIGVKRYMLLMKSKNQKNKYLLLDMKQALPSSLQPYVKNRQPAWASEAERVVTIQKRMEDVAQALLQPVVFDNGSYVIKRLQPTEDKISLDVLKDREELEMVIGDMAVLTASAQLRSSGRQGSAIADKLVAYGLSGLGEGQKNILDYARKYAKQVKKDYDEFMDGYDKGRYRE